ncbi:TetR/AcrR family transcriptional regulator [Nocardia sp. NBC_00881]|uniref:TetR/AcrR family transcriptional regulator n=1 Tax=Nocardia sp. NBC_00881 TaxID=2975995 RepID=UPI00386A528D|nr:TetR/AcrR family transcriptional regulator [Nocardia sp. NBC_00881]
MPAPRKFSREQLQTAALNLVDEQGLTGLTMRNLAAELGTGAMTIYNYVNGREGLEELVAAAVMSQARWAETGDDWAAQVAAIAEGMWRAVRAHPHAIPLILTRRSSDVATLAHAEALVRALSSSGRSSQELLVAFRTVLAYITGFAQAELTSPLSAATPTVVTERIAALPADLFPKLIEIAAVAANSDPQDEFRAGLQLILTGLQA